MMTSPKNSQTRTIRRTNYRTIFLEGPRIVEKSFQSTGAFSEKNNNTIDQRRELHENDQGAP